MLVSFSLYIDHCLQNVKSAAMSLGVLLGIVLRDIVGEFGTQCGGNGVKISELLCPS